MSSKMTQGIDVLRDGARSALLGWHDAVLGLGHDAGRDAGRDAVHALVHDEEHA